MILLGLQSLGAGLVRRVITLLQYYMTVYVNECYCFLYNKHVLLTLTVNVWFHISSICVIILAFFTV